MDVNWAHVHLIINHFPVVGAVGGVLLFGYAWARKSVELQRVSLGAFVLIALVTIPVFLSGEQAEDVVKRLSGVTETSIGRHEELAELSLVLLEALGALALTGLIWLKRKGTIPSFVLILVLVVSIITAIVVGFAANLGGQIRHTEIRAASPSPPAR